MRNVFYHDSVFQTLLIERIKNGFKLDGEEWKNVIFYLSPETVEAIVCALECDEEFENDSMWGSIISSIFYYEVLTNITHFNGLEWYWSGEAYRDFTNEKEVIDNSELINLIFDGFKKCLQYKHQYKKLGRMQISVSETDPHSINLSVGIMFYELKKSGNHPTPEEVAENIRKARERLNEVKQIE